MRTALVLLLLLALAAVPGSLVPQQGVDSQAYAAFEARNPELFVWLDRLGLFSVYTSPWFSSIYLLLAVSLVGCIVPRALVYLRGWRAQPSRAPRRLDRLPAWRQVVTGEDAEVEEVLERLAARMRRPGTRVHIESDEVWAQSGHLRELGNLVFHISLVVVMVGVAAGALLGYRGFVIVSEGGGFSNTPTQYDEITSGAMSDPQDRPPFSMRLDQVDARFQLDGPQRGSPRLFRATGVATAAPGRPERPFDIKVNRPLTIDGTSIFLVGQGYSPVIRVRDGRGQVVFDEAVPFLPQDPTYTSNGVVKVPDARPAQLGFQGYFLPTAVRIGDNTPVSAFPAAANPNVGLFGFYGDLGLDEGVPQSVYTLDRSRLTRMVGEDGEPFRINLSLGQVADLPQGRGTVEFVGLAQFARFRVTSQPGMVVPLVAGSIGLAGLMLSLYIRPRRTWARAERVGSTVVVQVGALEPRSSPDLQEHLDRFVAAALPGSSGRRSGSGSGSGADADADADADAAPPR